MHISLQFLPVIKKKTTLNLKHLKLKVFAFSKHFSHHVLKVKTIVFKNRFTKSVVLSNIYKF